MLKAEHININDGILFEKIKQGDQKAFEQVFRQHYVHLVAFANTILHDTDKAESIVQNVFVKLWEKRKQYQVVSLKGYLMIAVKNSCNNEIKRLQQERNFRQSADKTQISETMVYSDSWVMDKISSIINQLPEQRKKIFKLSRLEGLKYREIAAKLNISPKTVEIQMGKALKFLRENLVELKKQVYHILW
ncbi:RNA polymerase sigma-70 factor [Plebeiibacterium marinum]|uniref:RNA polymerase sigma-70 factor n=1 Tax=Plebeiibacterium marinum TaxID=2992111 RepID=A0AAE3MF34_9BACT|nr:RNA polymerase sigma-70 factor [Plebeiobacterium marinum]MCW3806576.1 RNA polymerase sigma-70 factor [Plebeiobacterium marinum]